VTGEPAGLVTGTALAITAAGLAAAAIATAATRRPLLGLQVLLDFLLAAGLLRLTGSPDWPVLATAAAVLGLRRLVGFGLRVGAPARPRATTAGIIDSG
jgi:hypothetical protein